MRLKNLYDYYEGEKFIMHGTLNEISVAINKPITTLYHYIRINKFNRLVTVGKEYPAYAFYDGEELVASGTQEEILEKTGLSIQSLRWYMTPAARRRTNKSLVRLEGEFVRVKHGIPTQAYKSAQINEREQKKKIKYKKATPEVWKPSRHSKMLFDMNFRKWGIEG